MLISRAAVAAAACAAALAFSATSAQAATLTGGTSVSVTVGQTISSSTAKAGQTFQILAAAPVMMGGQVVIKKGAAGQGKVVAATPAGKSGKQGTMSLRFLWIYAADGSKVVLSASKSVSGKNKTGSSNAANIAGTLLLGPVGLFAHNFVKGHDIVIKPGQTLTAYVDHTVTVAGSSM